MIYQDKKMIFAMKSMGDVTYFSNEYWNGKEKIYSFEIEDLSGNKVLNVGENYAMAAVILNELEIDLGNEDNVSEHLISTQQVTDIVNCFKDIPELKKISKERKKHHNLRKFRMAKRTRVPLTVTFTKVKE